MSCLACNNLLRALETARNEYISALGSPGFLVCNRFAAYKSVELERARNELEEHRSACVFARNVPAPSHQSILHEPERHEELEAEPVEWPA